MDHCLGYQTLAASQLITSALHPHIFLTLDSPPPISMSKSQQAAEQERQRGMVEKMEHENPEEDENSLEFLSKPIKAIEEKWKLLPHFLRMRGLMRQHIDSFDHFVNVEIKKIIQARSNCEVRSEADSKFFLRYTDIYVGEPNIEEESFVTTSGMVHHLISSLSLPISSLSSFTPSDTIPMSYS
jgi:hypothetical protein